MPAEVLKRFDKDGDGKLDATERAAAKAAFANRQGGDRRAPGAAAASAKPDTGRVDKQELLKYLLGEGKKGLTVILIWPFLLSPNDTS